MATCKSCDAPVRWAKTVAGKSIPLDPVPTNTGNIRLVQGGGTDGGLLAEVMTGDVLAEHLARGKTTYTTHFATCPNAKAHRRG